MTRITVWTSNENSAIVDAADYPQSLHMNNNKWLYNDVLVHRTDGPAWTFNDSNGCQEYWFLNGEIHRDDGPAVLSNEGIYFYLNGNHISIRKFIEIKKIAEEESSLMILKYGESE